MLIDHERPRRAREPAPTSERRGAQRAHLRLLIAVSSKDAAAQFAFGIEAADEEQVAAFVGLLGRGVGIQLRGSCQYARLTPLPRTHAASKEADWFPVTGSRQRHDLQAAVVACLQLALDERVICELFSEDFSRRTLTDAIKMAPDVIPCPFREVQDDPVLVDYLAGV